MNKLLDEKQAAALLNLSVKTLQARRTKGGGPRFVKLGRSVRYAMADLEAFVVASQRSSTSDPGRSSEFHFPPGIRVVSRVITGRGLQPGQATVSIPAPTTRPALRVPTPRRHSVPRGRVRARLVLPNQHVNESAPPRAR